jgi:hypothetical protein
MNVSLSATMEEQEDGTYHIVYSVFNKERAHQYMFETYGPNRENWPYSPYKKHKNYRKGIPD